MQSRQIIYFLCMVIVGGVLWAFGQSWAVGGIAGGCAGATLVGVSLVWNRRWMSKPRGDETKQQKQT